jgi:polyadenylate-binding protein
MAAAVPSAAPAAAAAPAAEAPAAAAPARAPGVGFASTSLYVGDLAADVTDAHLFDIFSQVGPVASVRVCRDAATRRSLGYAYVNFHTSVDAERALDTMNFKDIRGKACRIMWSQRDPSIRKSGLGNVFVKGLAKGLDHKALYDAFSIFGNILSCKVAQNSRTKESLGYGFVQFADEAAATEAVARANNTSLATQRISVQAFKPKSLRIGNDKAQFTNVFVKNIPESIDTKEKLAALFAKLGDVSSTALTFPPPLPEKKKKGDAKSDEKDAKDSKDKSGRTGFGFVNFKTPEQATAVVQAMNGFDVSGRKLYVARAQKKEERERENKERIEKERNERHSKFANTNLYIKNLADTIDDERLRNEFKTFGNITSAKVMIDSNKKSRGFGFVCFSSQEEATKAVGAMNGVLLENKPLYVALAQRKEVRRATLEALYARRGAVPMYPFGVPMMQPQMYRGGWQQPYGNPMMQRGARMPYQQVPQQMMPYSTMIPVQRAMGPQAGRGGRGRPMRGGAAGGMPRGGAAGVAPAGRGRGGAAGQPQVKYNQNVRNQPQPAQPQPAQTTQPEAATEADVNAPLDSGSLAKLPEEQRKQVLGERIFPLIAKDQPELAGKITGMLLEMDNTELLHLLESPQALQEKIEEALTVLKTHDAGADA